MTTIPHGPCLIWAVLAQIITFDQILYLVSNLHESFVGSEKNFASVLRVKFYSIQIRVNDTNMEKVKNYLLYNFVMLLTSNRIGGSSNHISVV
jgi:hypothetical protein